MDEVLTMLADIKSKVSWINETIQLVEEVLRKDRLQVDATAKSDQVTTLDQRLDPLCGLDATKGLHCVKDQWVHVSHLTAYCQYLASGENFRTACKETRLAAPRRWERKSRGMLYLDPHPEKPDPDQTMRESRLERAMFRRWGSPDSHVKGAWQRLIKYQVPLKEKIKSPTGLKAIDLVAVTEAGLPMIVELKVMHSSPETPLRAILEAAAYGCVLEAAWEPKFRQELADRLRSFSMDTTLPLELNGCPLVIAAPRKYWKYWSAHPLMRDAAPTFIEFLSKANDRGFPVAFVSIDGPGINWENDLPHNWQELRAEKIGFPHS